MNVALVVALVVLPLAASVPNCGRRVPSQLRDHDAICLNIEHDVDWLQELLLINRTNTGTRVSNGGLPASLAPKSSTWLSLQDGVCVAGRPKLHTQGRDAQGR